MIDGPALGLLAAFGVWGAFRGSARQVLMLAVAIGAIPLATRLAPGLEPTVAKVVSVASADRPLAAWGAAYAGLLVGGGLALALLQPFLQKIRLPGERVWGAVLGVAHGAVVLTVIVLGLLLAIEGEDAPAPLGSLPGSRTARVATTLGRGLGRLLPLHPGMGVETRVRFPPAARRPTPVG